VINEYDPFAVKIFLTEQELGFVPREFSKIISIEIDINNTQYNIVVTDVSPRNGYNEIIVTMAIN
jgi:hypothetical protein